ncbi:hypothetical protein CFIO01_00944 [Colletotrichum fioriniae PJ7]|uniref:Uncharacterized protein n=1 Tax=Colletotrichum fioriniae PJ7 TaxID=1445577 RepID=A0A010S612_9PEZI|nr:hypothetical protein CFIO01_00944 [Colletotrichum fioriniae PJ7]
MEFSMCQKGLLAPERHEKGSTIAPRRGRQAILSLSAVNAKPERQQGRADRPGQLPKFSLAGIDSGGSSRLTPERCGFMEASFDRRVNPNRAPPRDVQAFLSQVLSANNLTAGCIATVLQLVFECVEQFLWAAINIFDIIETKTEPITLFSEFPKTPSETERPWALCGEKHQKSNPQHFGNPWFLGYDRRWFSTTLA